MLRRARRSTSDPRRRRLADRRARRLPRAFAQRTRSRGRLALHSMPSAPDRCSRWQARRRTEILRRRGSPPVETRVRRPRSRPHIRQSCTLAAAVAAESRRVGRSSRKWPRAPTRTREWFPEDAKTSSVCSRPRASRDPRVVISIHHRSNDTAFGRKDARSRRQMRHGPCCFPLPQCGRLPLVVRYSPRAPRLFSPLRTHSPRAMSTQWRC